ncbi:MAG: hypothetical protein SGARI_004843 [Bacillariaceae sp.]
MSTLKSASTSRSTSPVPSPPTSELVKTWPESNGDDASIHVETTTKLITSIQALLKDLQDVEGVIKTKADLRQSLSQCQVPINLLDLLDHGDGLNPDCFSRGLLREALGQLGGLKRRKLALEMLGAAVQSGFDAQQQQQETGTVAEKRSRDSEEKEEPVQPPAKKAKTQA